MTGWRIGYAAGPAKLIGAMKKFNLNQLLTQLQFHKLLLKLH
jgi:aspartate/methionine/tyrosine aminotransferase